MKITRRQLRKLIIEASNDFRTIGDGALTRRALVGGTRPDIEYIVDDCSINTASFDDLFNNSVDDESEEEIEDGKSIISKWIEVGNGVETNKNLGPERISVSGTRGTIMVSLSDYKIQIFDGEDDGEDSDEDEDEDEMELED